ncbi:helix-turn-helix domain-containing protein [Verrucomicrobiota bacterium sgz303538]
MPKATPLAPKAHQERSSRHQRRNCSAWRTKQNDWLGSIAAESHFHKLFDLLDGVHFFAKNRNGETMLSSRGILQLYGMSDESEIVGLTDFDLNPATMAESYVRDDEQVYATGEPILDKVELWFDEQGLPDWYVVSKLPVRSREQQIIGVMGILRRFSGNAELPATHREVAPAIQYIRTHFHRHIDLADLAKVVGLSPRQLQRKFRQILGLSPQELLIKTRVLAASRALREGDSTIAEISATCGFYDQSSFTEHFRRYMGQTPLRFRKAPHAVANRRQR